jgi:hypothetical protein
MLITSLGRKPEGGAVYIDARRKAKGTRRKVKGEGKREGSEARRWRGISAPLRQSSKLKAQRKGIKKLVSC